MTPPEPERAPILLDLRFDARLDAEAIATLAASTGMRISGVHDPERDTPGTGFLGEGDATVMLTLSRMRHHGWRLLAFSHHPDRCDRGALADLRRRLLEETFPALGAGWVELPPEVEPVSGE